MAEEFTHFTSSLFCRLLFASLLLLCVEACYKNLLPNEGIVYGDPDEMIRTPFSMEARRDGYIRIINPLQTEINYTINGGEVTSNGKQKVLIIVKAGDVVQLYGNANTYNGARIECSSPFYVYGNIMSLIRADGFESIEEIPEENTFKGLFYGNSYIYNHPEKELILSATVMKPYCYSDMFFECTGLVVAPKLPATVLAKGCYQEMFSGCTNIKTAPKLPALSLESHCYTNMFKRCASLTKAPELLATTLAEACYSGMFEYCTRLTSAPELPATTLASWCYARMFACCESLKVAPELPATIMVKSCYGSMFYECSNLKKAPALPALSLDVSCYMNMFAKCTRLITAPSLPATQLAPSCYSAMFNHCIKLNEAPELPATKLAPMCYADMFSYCINLEKAPELPARELVSNCYYHMFQECSKLRYIKALFTTSPGRETTMFWVQNVAKSGVFVKSVAASWGERGDNGIPEGWTVEHVR